MRSWLNQLGDSDEETGGLEIHTYEVEYDREAIFHQFRTFKEQKWNNWEVPYVRYYSRGNLVHESNFVSIMTFIDNLRLEN